MLQLFHTLGTVWQEQCKQPYHYCYSCAEIRASDIKKAPDLYNLTWTSSDITNHVTVDFVMASAILATLKKILLDW